MSGQPPENGYDLQAVINDEIADSGIHASAELGRKAGIADCRATVTDSLGEAAMLDAAATIAAFNAFPRVADATGIPLEEMKVQPTAGIRADLGLEAFNLTGKLPG